VQDVPSSPTARQFAYRTILSSVTDSATPERQRSKPAFLVASGIFLSRVAGLVRDRVFAHFFGNSDSADAFRAAFRIPNFLQNLFGEGVLSASFIPVYANLLAREAKEEAGRVAGAIASLLVLLTSLLVLIGVVVTPWLIAVIAPGFSGDKRELTIVLVRILFPGAGLLVFSAWCLGILNSHRKFFISYVAPVIWNAAIVVTLILFGRHSSQPELAVKVAWGSVVGSGLQFLVQLPLVLRLIPHLNFALALGTESVRTVVRNFVPVFISRGVVQISAYIDALIASFLPTGAVAALAYAQTIYTLPVSLFGMSVSAAELPAMSSALGSEEEIGAQLRERLARGARQISFLVIPSVMAFLVLGDVVAAAIYQSGRFTHDDAIYVWGVLAGSTVGLLASTLGRLYASAFYALRDTKTPLKFASVRVFLTLILGYFSALPLPRMMHIDPRWGVAGLTASAGIAGWVEFALLRSRLGQRIGRAPLSLAFLSKVWGSAAVAAGVGYLLKARMQFLHPIPLALVVLGVYGVLFFLLTTMLHVPEVASLLRRFGRAK
jgi:putative peptidoglycan lipid II flippase